jgi:hypothetical protein
MPTKQVNPRDVYELIENDEGEIMVLIFAFDEDPQSAFFYINEKRKTLDLYRSKNNIVIIDNLKKETIAKLKKTPHIYICEMKYNENPDAENEIVYAYTAEQKEAPTIAPKPETLSEKAKKARESVLKNSSDN